MLLTKAYRRTKMSVVIARGLKRIWDYKMGTPSSARITEDVDLALKALEIVYRSYGAAVGEVHEPKVRVASANSPKRYSFTVICCSCV